MRLDELLRVTPGEAEAAAGRARRRALARFDREAAPAGGLLWRPAAAVLALCVTAVVLITSRGPADIPAPAPPAHRPLRVEMKLSDGTRVQWTFHDGFRL